MKTPRELRIAVLVLALTSLLWSVMLGLTLHKVTEHYEKQIELLTNED